MAFLTETRIGWDKILSGEQYSDRFRAQRKNIHAVIGTKAAVSRFFELQEAEVRRFLFRVLESPEELLHHIRTFVSSRLYCNFTYLMIFLLQQSRCYNLKNIARLYN